MEFTTLGRTGLKVSVAGLGCGGPSRLGMRNDPQSANHAVALVKQAIDLGVNFLDTAQNYGTESVVGKAIAGMPRDRLVISTKKTLPPADHSDPEAEVVKGLEQSLKLIGTDYIDVYHLHGVEPKDYDFAKDRLMPAMRRLEGARKDSLHRRHGRIRGRLDAHGSAGRSQGRFVGRGDGRLQPAESLWRARRFFRSPKNNGAGVLNMFAVRRALSQPERLKEICAELAAKGLVAKDAFEGADPLGVFARRNRRGDHTRGGLSLLSP